MRKTLMALLVALSATMGAYGAVDTNPPPATYQEFLQAHEQWNRFATIKQGDKVIIERDPNTENPFPDKATCVAGLVEDTNLIYVYLQSQGVDITSVDVTVFCEPAGSGI